MRQSSSSLVVFLHRLQKNQSGKVRETLGPVSRQDGSVTERGTSQKEWYVFILFVEVEKYFFIILCLCYQCSCFFSLLDLQKEF